MHEKDMQDCQHWSLRGSSNRNKSFLNKAVVKLTLLVVSVSDDMCLAILFYFFCLSVNSLCSSYKLSKLNWGCNLVCYRMRYLLHGWWSKPFNSNPTTITRRNFFFFSLVIIFFFGYGFKLEW